MHTSICFIKWKSIHSTAWFRFISCKTVTFMFYSSILHASVVCKLCAFMAVRELVEPNTASGSLDGELRWQAVLIRAQSNTRHNSVATTTAVYYTPHQSDRWMSEIVLRAHIHNHANTLTCSGCAWAGLVLGNDFPYTYITTKNATIMYCSTCQCSM